jgi:hypothetical protein
MVGPRLDDKNNVGFGVLWIAGNGVVFDADLMKTRQKKKPKFKRIIATMVFIRWPTIRKRSR